MLVTEAGIVMLARLGVFINAPVPMLVIAESGPNVTLFIPRARKALSGITPAALYVTLSIEPNPHPKSDTFV